MNSKLENQYISLTVNSHGAELTSMVLKSDGTEYMWNADPKVWARHAPVLFPIVGRVVNNQYKVENEVFSLPQHGFARDMEFERIACSPEQVLYRLNSSPETMAKYPWQFCFDIGYRLQKNGVTVEYRVQNTDCRTMYFSLGAHPGFNCPLLAQETFADYYFELAQPETGYKYTMEQGVIVKRALFLAEQTQFALTKEMFDGDTYIIPAVKSGQISLKSRKSNKGVSMTFEGFPYMAVWAPPGEPPFVCIEPWCGIADKAGTPGALAEKEGICTLEPGQEFCRSYTISVW